jgi:hypothetical protein
VKATRAILLFLSLTLLNGCKTRSFSGARSEADAHLGSAAQDQRSELAKVLPQFWAREKSKSTTSKISPIRSRSGLNSPVEESVVPLPRAKVVLADYDLLARDFLGLKQRPAEDLRNWHSRVDNWLLRNSAYLAKSQVEKGVPLGIMSDPGIGTFPTKTPIALRPRLYGRALVYELQGELSLNAGPSGKELIDVKGAGSLTPKAADHENGLATLGEAIREFALEKMVSTVFAHADQYQPGNLPNEAWLGAHTNRVYAVLSCGFNVLNPSLANEADANPEPAGLVLRRSHGRLEIDPEEPFEPIDMAYQVTVTMERTLRQYGISSSGDTREGAREDLENLQLSTHFEVLDFGAFFVPSGFHRPAVDFNELQFVARKSRKRDGAFFTPNEQVRVPFSDWGTSVSNRDNPQYDNLWIRSRELAKPFLKSADPSLNHFPQHEYNKARQDTESYLFELLSRLRTSWEVRGVPLR